MQRGQRPTTSIKELVYGRLGVKSGTLRTTASENVGALQAYHISRRFCPVDRGTIARTALASDCSIICGWKPWRIDVTGCIGPRLPLYLHCARHVHLSHARLPASRSASASRAAACAPAHAWARTACGATAADRCRHDMSGALHALQLRSTKLTCVQYQEGQKLWALLSLAPIFSIVWQGGVAWGSRCGRIACAPFAKGSAVSLPVFCASKVDASGHARCACL